MPVGPGTSGTARVRPMAGSDRVEYGVGAYGVLLESLGRQPQPLVEATSGSTKGCCPGSRRATTYRTLSRSG